MSKKDLIDILMMIPLAWLGATGKTVKEGKGQKKTALAHIITWAQDLMAGCLVAALIVPLARLMNLSDYMMCLGAIFGGYAGFSLLDKGKEELEAFLKRRYGSAK